MAEEKKDGFIVSDKRKFTDEGELRPEAAEETKEAPEQKQTASAPASSAPPAVSTAPESSGSRQQEEEMPPPTAAEQAGQHEEYRKGTKQLDDLLSARGHGAGGQQFEMTFARFVESLYMTALIQLGAIRPEGAGEQVRVDIIGARQTIDTIGLLQEKTKGNLTPEEERLMQTVLFELRMAFVEMTNALNKAAMQPPPGATPPKR